MSVVGVNYTVMQADAGREMQNLRSFAQDTVQPVIVQKAEKHDAEKRETVQQSGEQDQIKFEREKQEQKRQKRRQAQREREEASEKTIVKKSVRTKRKRLLDLFV